ncbi:LOW QUALITY PROTEIN: acyl-coenzyme A synthetase ACSM3, mitochondrial-like, partial [Saccoglossus kowalevskii]
MANRLRLLRFLNRTNQPISNLQIAHCRNSAFLRKVHTIRSAACHRNQQPLPGAFSLRTLFPWQHQSSGNIQQKRCFLTAISSTGFNDYELGRKDFRLDVPEYFNFAGDVLDEWAEREKNGKRRGRHPALWWVDDDGNQLKWTFQDLQNKSKKVANILTHGCQLKRLQRVIVILPRVPEWWLFNIACLRTATILSPGTIQLTAQDIRKRLQASDAACIVTDESCADSVDQVSSDCPKLKTKLLVSQNGKTRSGWMDFKSLYEKASEKHECVKTHSDEPMTVYFTSGTTDEPKMCEHTHGSYGLAHVITGKYWLDLNPTDVHWNMSDTGWAKSAWSNFFAPWTQGACVFVHHTLRFDPVKSLQILNNYPITTFCTAPTVYRLFVQEDLSLYNLQSLRHTLSAGEPLDDDNLTKSAFKGDYYFTGDRAVKDDDGFFWFVGRNDDVILSAGYRIGPFEVESALIEHDAVAESAVVSSPDQIRGEVVKAFVVISKDYEVKD